MPEPSKKLSRRDAIKLIGAAAGASVLASLPTKWMKPEITTGVLPVHAQTSWPYSFVACDPSSGEDTIISGTLHAQITPAVAGISLNLAITNNTGVSVSLNPSGTYQTDGSGQANSSSYQLAGASPQSITFEWTFVDNPSAPSCKTTFTWVL